MMAHLKTQINMFLGGWQGLTPPDQRDQGPRFAHMTQPTYGRAADTYDKNKHPVNNNTQRSTFLSWHEYLIGKGADDVCSIYRWPTRGQLARAEQTQAAGDRGEQGRASSTSPGRSIGPQPDPTAMDRLNYLAVCFYSNDMTSECT